MKATLLFVILVMWFINTQAQINSKIKPQENSLINNDSISAGINVKHNLRQTNAINGNSISTRVLRSITIKDSVLIFRGDSILFRRNINSPAHKLEQQIPVESPLIPDNAEVANKTKTDSTKNVNSGKP